MSRPKLPEEVALPDVCQHTEDIILGSLGSPLGFDQERLLVNLRSFDRARKIAGFGRILVSTTDFPAETVGIDISTVDKQGTASLRAVGARPKKPLAQGKIQYHRGKGGLLVVPDVAIRVNHSELEARIEDKEGNVFDPQLRAKFFNTSIRKGLSQASLSASFGVGNCLLSATMYGLAAAEYGVPNTTWAYLGVGASTILCALDVHRRVDNGEGLLDAIKRQRPSLFYGATPDRYMAAAGFIALGRFIKAR